MKFPSPKGPKNKILVPMPWYVRRQFVKAGRKGGLKKSEAKAKAARENAKVQGKKRGPKTGVRPKLESSVLADLPSEVEILCSCGEALILSRKGVSSIQSGKGWEWDCPACGKANRTTSL